MLGDVGPEGKSSPFGADRRSFIERRAYTAAATAAVEASAGIPGV